MFLPDGTLKIIDRKKNIFKLSQGEYIIPEKVEQALTGSTLISQAFVYGDSFQHFLVAILVPEFSHLNKWAANNGLPTDNQAALLANEATIQLF
jgi:long-chain acyl-CoA synthetase